MGTASTAARAPRMEAASGLALTIHEPPAIRAPQAGLMNRPRFTTGRVIPQRSCRLPDLHAFIFGHEHFIAFFYTECLIKFFHIA